MAIKAVEISGLGVGIYGVSDNLGLTPQQGTNTTAASSTTVRPVIAAPGAGKSLYIQAVTVRNEHATEDPIVRLQDTAGTPIIVDSFALSGIDAPTTCQITRTYDPPLKLTSNKGLDVVCTASAGTVFCTARGFYKND